MTPRKFGRQIDPEKRIGTAEAAAIARVAQNTVNYWIREKQLRAKITPQGYQIRAGDLLDLLDEREAELDGAVQ